MHLAQAVNGLPAPPGNLALPRRSMEAKPCLLLPCRSIPIPFLLLLALVPRTRKLMKGSHGCRSLIRPSVGTRATKEASECGYTRWPPAEDTKHFLLSAASPLCKRAASFFMWPAPFLLFFAGMVFQAVPS